MVEYRFSELIDIPQAPSSWFSGEVIDLSERMQHHQIRDNLLSSACHIRHFAERYNLKYSRKSRISKDIITMGLKTFDSAVYNEHIVGRKTDLMTTSSGVDLSTSEWKKEDADKTTGREQRIKNVRGNKATLKKLLSLPIADSGREKVSCLGLEFVDIVGYMFSVHCVDDAYVITPVSDLRLPTDLTELNGFIKTLDSLYKFKNHHMTLQKIIDPAYRRHQEEQTLAQLRTPVKRSVNDNESDEDDDRELPDSPNTFYSPRKKRTNSRQHSHSDLQ